MDSVRRREIGADSSVSPRGVLGRVRSKSLKPTQTDQRGKKAEKLPSTITYIEDGQTENTLNRFRV
jgi:hypothetical protein